LGTFASLNISGAIDVDGVTNLDVTDIDGAVDMASTLQVDGVATFTGRDIHSGGITIANAGQIGSVGDTDAIAIASDGVVTLTQKLVGTELDISGNVDIDGTLETDAITIGGVTLSETIADTVGAMVTSSTKMQITQ
jgi:cytoskeletal protein CcmA (bactofilin family)